MWSQQLMVGGVFPNNPQILTLLDRRFDAIRARLARTGAQGQMQFLFAPAYGSREWYAWSRQNGPVQCFCAAQEGQMDSRFDSVVQVDSPLRTSIGEVLCNHADLLLLTWNEDVTELDCATWELLRILRPLPSGAIRSSG